MFYVYLIKSEKNQGFYIGQTENISERFLRHNSGFVASTRNRRPWSLIGYEEYNTREEARWREYNLKTNYSEKKKFINKLTTINKTYKSP